MSGEDRAERGTPPDGMRARAAKAEQPRAASGPPPLPDAADPAPAPAPKVKREKPPPAFISGGALDSGRGHAANILPRAPVAPTPAPPRVVLTVETDSRRVPTAPRLIAGGKGDSERPPPAVMEAADAAALAAASPSPWGTAAVEVVDKRDLPSANLPIVAAPVIAPQKPRSSGWLRYAVVLMMVLLAAGVVRRVRGMGGPEAATAPPSRTIAVAPPLDPEAAASPTAIATAHVRSVAALAPADPDPSAAPSADPSAEPSAEPTVGLVAPRPRLAPPPPRPTFKPLFELPAEKAKETP